MEPTPHIQPLSRRHRTIIFTLSVLLFFTIVPLMVFYAIGYRFDFSDDTTNIRAVGGLYVNAPIENTEIYLDDELINDFRIFQRAAYIQNVDAGVHQVHVQGQGVQTWVKELPVFSHFVTEAASFNVPSVPQVRYVAPYVNARGEQVYFNLASTSLPQVATTTQSIVFATSSPRLSTVEENPEFVYLAQLFASTTEERARLEEMEERRHNEVPFRFGQVTLPTTTATTTVTERDMRLERQGAEVVATWTGARTDVPYYFCINELTPSTTARWYGEHVADAIYDESSVSGLASTTFSVGGRVCRSEIQLDRLRESVEWFWFLPGDSNLVLLHLASGLYVTEIDDRSWQNVQSLYRSGDMTVIVDGGRIFIEEKDVIFEVSLTLPS